MSCFILLLTQSLAHADTLTGRVDRVTDGDTIVILDSDIIAAHANQDKTLRESAADLGAMILEMEREEELHGKNSERLAELRRVRALQEKVVMRTLEGGERPKGPRLRVVE